MILVLLPNTDLADAEFVARGLITSVTIQVVEVGGKLFRYYVVACIALMDPEPT